VKKTLIKLRHVLRRVSIGIFLKLFGFPSLNRRVEQRIIFSWSVLSKSFPETYALDVACGSGYLTRLMIESQSLMTVGIDVRRNIISTAHRIAKSQSSRCHFFVADAHFLPFKENVFSKIFCNCSLEHFADDSKVLSEIYRICLHNGKLFLTVDSMKQQLSPISLAFGRALSDDKIKILEKRGLALSDAFKVHHRMEYYVVNFYTFKNLSLKLCCAGFKIEGHQSYFSNITGFVFELHDGIIRFLHWDSDLAMVLFPIFYPLTFLDGPDKEGYGLAVYARKCSTLVDKSNLKNPKLG